MIAAPPRRPEIARGGGPRRGLRAAVLLALHLAPLPGCRPRPPPVLAGPASADEAAQPYEDVVAAWSRAGSLYAGLDSKLFVRATFHAPALRRAVARRFPEIYGHGGAITRHELVDLGAGVEDVLTFFLAAYTPDVRWNDLGRQDSIWRLLVHGDDGPEVAAVEVVPVRVDENLRAVYPYIGRFDLIYLARFPRTDPAGRPILGPTTRHLGLRVASALGQVVLDWELTPSPVASTAVGSYGTQATSAAAAASPGHAGLAARGE